MATRLKIDNYGTVEFSPWVPWLKRTTIGIKYEPGVYALALGVKEGEEFNPLDRRVIYFGQTCGKLAGRWGHFHREAFGDGGAHAGATTYKKLVNEPPHKLYVSACTVNLQDKLERHALIRLIERKLILDFIREHRRLPKCNKQ